jgi:MFS family permease
VLSIRAVPRGSATPDVSLLRRERHPGHPRPRLFIDLSALRQFPLARRIVFGLALTQTGAQITAVTLAFQVFEMTHSNFDVGIVSLVQILPTFLAGLIGGSLADAMNRRRLLVIGDVIIFAGSATLAATGALHVDRLWLIYVLAAVNTAGMGLDAPTRYATLFSVVDSKTLISANSIRQVTDRTAFIVGPSLAGLIIAGAGIETAYSIDAGAALMAIVALVSTGPLPASGGAIGPGIRSVLESIQFLRKSKPTLGCFLGDLNAMVLGMPTALFPAIAIRQFHGGAGVVGLLFAAPGAGALLFSLFSGWSSRVRRPGVAVCIAIACWGSAIAAFGFSRSLGVAVVMLAIAGAADTVSVLFLSTIIQSETPEVLRGRVSALQTGILGNGPRLGGVESGLVASLANIQFAVVSGGIGCIAGVALIAWRFPSFFRYRFDADAPQHSQSASGSLAPGDPAGAGA